jgi:hypothetical protein
LRRRRTPLLVKAWRLPFFLSNLAGFSCFPERNSEKPQSFDWGFALGGSPSRARTCDLRINSPSLYQLSYQGIEKQDYTDATFLCQTLKVGKNAVK